MLFTIDDATFEALRITGATWTVSAGGETTLRLTVAGPLTNAATWAAYQQVILKADSTEIFRGNLDQAPRRATGEEEGWEYLFTGPVRQLDRKIYEQPLKVLGYDPATGTTLTILDPTGQTMLGMKSVGDGTLTPYSLTHATIREVLEEILDQTGLTYTLPETGLTAQVPWEAREDDTILAALRQILKWSPDLCLRWTANTLTIHRPDLGTPTNLTAAGWDHEDIALNPRYDLGCASVTIKYLRRRNTLPPYDITLDTATGGITGGRELIKSIYLEEGEPPLAPGIAAEFLAWAGRIHIDATIGFRGITLSRQVGDTYTIDGALGALGTIPTVCQTITRDLIRRTETLTLGVPRHLGLDDLIALKRKPYRRPDPGDNEQPEESGTLSIDISGPDDGVWSSSEATWTVGDQSGKGSDSIELPPGNYTVIFNPVFKPSDGYLYFADPYPVTVTNGGTPTATAVYLSMSKLVLASATGDETLELSQNAIKLYDAAGDGVYADIAGWIQQQKDSKEIYLDPADVPEDATIKALQADNGFAGLKDTEDCEEEEV